MDLHRRATGDVTDAALRGLVRRGELVRVSRGSYGPGSEWASASPDERYRLRVLGVMAGRTAVAVASHESAAALHRLPLLAPDRDRVHVSVDGRGGGASTRRVAEHRVPLSLLDVTTVDGVQVTTPTRTALDIACTVGLDRALCAVESALRTEAPDLHECLARLGRRRGIATARRAVDLASPLTESIGESWSRALMMQWPEIPSPRLQHRFLDDRGRIVARTDFDWDGRLVGEFDGLMKYRGGAQSVIDEKLREDALRALGCHVVRWTWDDLRHPERLRRLLAAGMAIAFR
ncbi:type IV toxin-antitoxin system AbiEi family antitoxin domain-containing protein [Rhodococcus sp. UNC23MFCrub1.1]|uniref:type IV toxin-antitoxin system AbiEi family antitoxin domain-containing protein n=1 Tax=Rhodococcus sp. UNC23MFCrub1.1 TaxID=1449068 RepID=UPI00069198FB|nr:hypothetical protein [Rhodococcus sp. UNC23MFCrub1.1]